MTTFNKLTGAVYFCLSMVIMVSCQKELTPEKMGLDNSTLRITNSTLSAKAALGRKIYFDNNFSSPSLTQSCSSCHLPGQGFTGKGNVAPSLTNAPNTPRGFIAGIAEGAVSGAYGGRKPPSASYATYS
ncbi:MAG: cytochrome c peroxidase, partial [Bacteroidota bacterium]